MMLVTPTTCYHSFIELYFELVPTDKLPCQNNYSYSRGDTSQFTGKFKKKALQSLLSTKVLANGKTPQYKSFVKSLKENKTTIFHADNIPGTKMGPIHALVLQLLGKGIIAFDIADSTKVGTKELNDSHVIFYLPTSIDDDGTNLPAYTIDSCCGGLNWV